jgi:hypothetical protein
MQEREKRDKIHVGATDFSFSPYQRRNRREVANLMPFDIYALQFNTPHTFFLVLYAFVSLFSHVTQFYFLH